MPATLWVSAVQSTVFVVNRLPTLNSQGYSPFEKLFRRCSDYKFLKTFGCACDPNFSATSSNKLTQRSKLYIFLGYAPHYKGYRCFDPQMGSLILVGMLCFMNIFFPIPI